MKHHLLQKCFFLIKPVASAAGNRVRMKHRRAATANWLNVEHRTSNVELRILMTLRFIYFKTSELLNFEKLNHCALSFFKLIVGPWGSRRADYIIRCSMFDVHFLVSPSHENSKNQSFFYDQTGRPRPEAPLVWNYTVLEQRTAESWRLESLRPIFFKIDKIHSFDVRRSMLDVRCSTFISFFFDQTGRFFGQRRRLYET